MTPGGSLIFKYGRGLGKLMACLVSTLIATAAGCASPSPEGAMDLRPHQNTCEVIIGAPAPVGAIRLWVPEGIMSEAGACAVYPRGGPWERRGDAFRHEVDEAGLFGPGNFERVEPDTLECAGIRIPVDSPVRWRTTVVGRRDEVRFTIRLTNAGDRTIRKAGAAICVKFLEGDWWSDEHVFVLAGGRVRSLAELGWDAGPPNGFQAWLLRGETFDNVFYREFWGFNRNRLDAPVMVSEHPAGGVCVGIEADRAWFLHSNRGNPCTDVMLAFGDLSPGATAEAGGRIWIRPGKADRLLSAYQRR